ncbi:MAG: hypothetical protein QNJ48_03035 [Desulfobacterales bacterium]|nr:hypothetical protein [Desulfobacterales bacterium]MDJ0883103.1 hypothetical protein [Desulfobacterales bacterium]
MTTPSKSQKARMAIRSFKTVADAMGLRGHYRPSDRFGQALADSLRNLDPEIYGSMNDRRVVELKGLEYVIDRLPEGIEKCTRIILTEEEGFDETHFEKIEPPKRRRTSYRVTDREICFVITRGISEIYDILTHLTFLCIEAQKISERIYDESGHQTVEWVDLEKLVLSGKTPAGDDLDQALWNLSIIIGRSFLETRATHDYLVQSRSSGQADGGLFALVYHLGKRVEAERESKEDALIIYMTPSLMNNIGHHKYGKQWAATLKDKLIELGLQARPVHIISANLHSVVNIFYGAGALGKAGRKIPEDSIPAMVAALLANQIDAVDYGRERGLFVMPDGAGTHVDCQIIDTARLDPDGVHPQVRFSSEAVEKDQPVILVMDYAFGAQAFELMESLLEPYTVDGKKQYFDFRSIAIMGKAGILTGNKGDVMLANAHVIEGTTDNYLVHNDLAVEDFEGRINTFNGPMLTVVGTSLQNKDILRRIQRGWKAIGLEMEGGHYQRAINAALIKGHISSDIKTRYAYYASDNPLKSGQTLASGPMGQEGIAPTYLITQVLLEKICNPS